MAKIGALGALIVLILGFTLALPDQAKIGVMFLVSFQSTSCSGSNVSNMACQWIPNYILALQVFGVLLVLVDVLYIINEAKHGRW